MQSCFIGYIGLKQCGASGTSGDYINEMPGISTEMVGKIANSEQGNFLGVWQDVQKRAFRRLKQDLLTALAEKVNMNRIVYQTKKLKKQYRDLVKVPMAPNYRGVYVKIPEGNYVELYIKSIFVYSYQAVSTTIKVFDINDGTQLYTKDVTLVVGLNVIDIDEDFPLRWEIMELFIGIDMTSFDSVITQPEYYLFYNQEWDCVSSISHSRYNDNLFLIEPAELPIIDVASWSNVRILGAGQGVTIDAQVKCSISDFACQNKDILKTPFMYLLTAELLMEKNVSNQISVFTTTNLEVTENLRQDYENRYRDSLKRVAKSIPLEGNNLCFNCEEQKVVYTSGGLP